eukprot:48619_1
MAEQKERRRLESEARQQQQVHTTIDKKTTQILMAEQAEKRRLSKKYANTNRRLSQIQDKAALLTKENQELQTQLVMYTSVSVGSTLHDESEPESSPDIEDVKNKLQTDKEKIVNWLHYNKLKENQLKVELSTLLTEHNVADRVEIREWYKKKRVADVMDDISKVIRKGNTLEIIAGLFKSRAEFDAICIKEIIHNRSHKPVIEVAEIICCRDIPHLRQIEGEYNKIFGAKLKEKMLKLASGKTYQHVINHVFDFARHEHVTTNKIKIGAKVSGDVGYLCDGNVKWKKEDNKKRLALMVLGNNKDYVHDLNQQYFDQTKTNLVNFVDSKLGVKSTTGYWIKLRIEFCADPGDFYARKIQITGDEGWGATSAIKINRIFISTFGKELKAIQKSFYKSNYGDGKTLVQWIEKKCHSKHYSTILINMVQNSIRLF